ncbi:unnamed protein product [Arctogadus glacialis]
MRFTSYSPAQLMMGRRIRTPVPISSGQLQPQWPDLQSFREKDEGMQYFRTDSPLNVFLMTFLARNVLFP